MPDPESRATEDVYRALSDLDPEARTRVLRWAADRLDVAELSRRTEPRDEHRLHEQLVALPADVSQEPRPADLRTTIVSAARSAAELAEELSVRHRVLWVAVRRLALAVPILIVVPLVTFVLGRIALTYIPQDSFFPVEAPQQSFVTWLTNALTGDLGTSLLTGEPVARTLGYRIPVTVGLVVGTLLISALIGGALGVYSAVRGGATGRVLDALALFGFAFPAFWVAPVLVGWFAVDLRWFPAVFPFSPTPHDVPSWAHALALPITVLSFGGIAAVAKPMREAMLDTLNSESIRMARARGLAPASVVLRHALRVAAPKVITVLGVFAAGLLAGAVFVEIVFAIPGLGSQLLTSLLQHDLPIVEAIVVLFTLLIVAINLLIDLANAWLNPRVLAE
jgi:peptide/nickel transport system permease protein